MAVETSGFEATPTSQFPIADMRPLAIADSVHTALSSIIDVNGLQFVEQEGFPGLQTEVNELLARSVPRCGAISCGLTVELDDARGGIGEDTTLNLRCPRIKESTRGNAEAIESRCDRQHRRTSRWFGTWVRELAQSIGDAEQRRTDAEYEVELANDQMRDILH